MAKYLVAVSGGVDSVVLLDLLAKTKHTIAVAHVDHGIRGEESAADARFVKALAKKYGVPYISTQLHLGKHASEEQARDGRYEFLFSQAKKRGAQVMTAHHAGDVVETIALNLTRGTGWRGLAVLARSGITRPLLAMTKQQLYDYALKHRLEWVEDATNSEEIYLRNRLRRKIGAANIDTASLLALRTQQLQLRRDIDNEAQRLVQLHGGSRYFINMLEEPVAVEVLGAAIHQATGRRPVAAQLIRALYAIRTAAPHTIYQVGEGVSLQFTARNYTITVV